MVYAASGQAMKRRGKLTGKPSKARPKKARRSIAPKIAPYDLAEQEAATAQFRRERDEALEWQQATGEILSAIDASTSDPSPVFDAIVRNLIRLFGTKYAVVTLIRAGKLELVGARGELGFDQLAAHYPVLVNNQTLAGKVIGAGKPIRLTPIIDNPESPPLTEQWARQFNYNSQISVPLIRQGVTIGSISTAHGKATAFTDSQVELIQNFAAQAVIAIENTRLLNELRQRTDDLSESLEQQTATSEVLKVISSSPGELAPVFESLLASAKHLCGAEFGVIFLREGDGFRTVALHGATAEYTEARWRAPFVRPAADTGLGRVLETKQVVQIADVQAVAGYVDNPVQAPIVQLTGVRSKLSVPMLKEGDLMGVIEIDRQEVRPFTDKQIELVTNFAAQAVIAIENARLLNELRQRTSDLGEALEQQTATSQVLAVISSSQAQLKPVFETVVDRTTRICGATFACLGLFEGDALRFAAISGVSAGSEFFHPE